MKKDAALQKDIMTALEREPSIVHTNIGVSVSNGVVMLSGHVPSYAQKEAAEKAASRVAGVKTVVENLDVTLASSLIRDDDDIARSAANALRCNGLIPDGVSLSVEDGRVTLRGDVDWAYQREVAARCVNDVEGVIWVRNDIRIKEDILPANIKTKIEEALKHAAEQEAKKITVDVSDHKVILSGTVRSLADLDAVKGVAWSAPGVTCVECQLRVI